MGDVMSDTVREGCQRLLQINLSCDFVLSFLRTPKYDSGMDGEIRADTVDGLSIIPRCADAAEKALPGGASNERALEDWIRWV